MTDIVEVNAEKPFVAKNPRKGLRAYGPADAGKEIINRERDGDGYRVITVEFQNGDTQKVRLLGDKK